MDPYYEDYSHERFNGSGYGDVRYQSDQQLTIEVNHHPKNRNRRNATIHTKPNQSSAFQRLGPKVPNQSSGQSRKMINLQCPQCKVNVVTFKEYNQHLESSNHLSTMTTEVKIKLRNTLNFYRFKQRSDQKLIEREIKKAGETAKTNYCKSCKLLFHNSRRDHNLSQSHREMLKFLQPSCHTCNIRFKAPLLYEKHIASLSHIKEASKNRGARSETSLVLEQDFIKRQRVQILERQRELLGSPSCQQEEELEEIQADEGEEEEMGFGEFNREDFLTLDEVGGEDEEEEEEEEDGSAFVSVVQMLYCDLCKSFVGKKNDAGDDGVEIRKHCASEDHRKKLREKS